MSTSNIVFNLGVDASKAMGAIAGLGAAMRDVHRGFQDVADRAAQLGLAIGKADTRDCIGYEDVFCPHCTTTEKMRVTLLSGDGELDERDPAAICLTCFKGLNETSVLATRIMTRRAEFERKQEHYESMMATLRRRDIQAKSFRQHVRRCLA